MQIKHRQEKSNLEDITYIVCSCGKKNPITNWNCVSCGKTLQDWYNQLIKVINE